MRGDDTRDGAASVELLDGFVTPTDSSIISTRVMCQRPQDGDSILHIASRNAYEQDPCLEMVNGGVVQQWTCINFSRYVIIDAARQFHDEMARMSQTPKMVGKTSDDAFLLHADQVSTKERTEVCYVDQPMNPRMGRIDASGPWMEEGFWIYFIQYANGHMWERSCRDFQIHHVQPD
ncbi:unnamed protein product [Sphagnum jensenii]|uniref:Uncharacterized protein n=1 Tax=Sphagnum jensenii TaxID=128206 RepID=A0ABP1ARD9_9BRYO